jgi:uncharacterized membrane protein YidH (DUF202 family)
VVVVESMLTAADQVQASGLLAIVLIVVAFISIATVVLAWPQVKEARRARREREQTGEPRGAGFDDDE